MRTPGIVALLIVGGATCTPPVPLPSMASGHRPNPAAGRQAFVNGRWLTGDTSFEARAMYAVDGILTRHRPESIDTTFDLRGAWIIPPFGDAHNHMLGSPGSLEPFRGRYVREGTFYVQVLGNRATMAAQIRDQFNKPCTLDVTWANGFLTSTLGHGFEMTESKAMGIFDLHQALATREADLRASRIAENDGYWFIDSLPDVERKWSSILSMKPDLIKITLVFSSDSSERAPFAPPGWYVHGLRPQVVPEIVRRAHAAGLRVAAHVDTRHDVEVAVRAGVDILAHNAGYGVPEGREGDYLLTDDVARLAGAHGVSMIPTAATEQDFRDVADSIGLRRDLAVQRENLRLLTRHGVRIAIGPDMWGQTGRNELDALRRVGALTDAQLLHAWFETTPRVIFPQRSIGRLEEGDEASFLALRQNPFADIRAVDSIELRVKQGCVLH